MIDYTELTLPDENGNPITLQVRVKKKTPPPSAATVVALQFNLPRNSAYLPGL